MDERPAVARTEPRLPGALVVVPVNVLFRLGTQRADTEVRAPVRRGVGPGDGRCGVGVQRWLERSLAFPELGGGVEGLRRARGTPLIRPSATFSPRWGEGFDARQRAPIGTVRGGRAPSGRTRRSGLSRTGWMGRVVKKLGSVGGGGWAEGIEPTREQRVQQRTAAGAGLACGGRGLAAVGRGTAAVGGGGEQAGE